MWPWGIAVIVTMAGLLVIGFAVDGVRVRRRRERSLLHVARPPAPDIAYRAVVNARSAFTRAVQAYEEALAISARSRTGSALVGINPADGIDLQTMERQKDHRRQRLLDAQRKWEQVRPASGPNAAVNVWIAAGELRGWSLGLVGHEVAYVRIEHALDPECWVVVETRRVRIGPALGAERLDLGMVIEGAAIEQLTALIQQVMSSPEIAIRPGTSVLRWIARLQLPGKPLFDALRATVGRDSRFFVDGFEPGTAELALSYLGEVRGIDLTRSQAGLGAAFDRIELRATSSGPAVLVGAWLGRAPVARIVASSNHQAWLRPAES